MDWSEKGMRMDKCIWKDGNFKPCIVNWPFYMKMDILYINGIHSDFCPFCGADIRKPSKIEYVQINGQKFPVDKNTTAEELSEKVDPEGIESIVCLQCFCISPAGHNYCPECGKALDGIDPEKSNYDEFLKKFIEHLYEDSDVPIDILKSKYNPDWIEGRMKMMSPLRPSIDPVKEETARNVMDKMLFPDGFDFPDIKKTDCTECGNPNPEECKICLDTFESSRSRELNPGVDFEQLYCNQIRVAAKVFTDNIIMKTESESLKKLFVEEHREKIELVKSVGLLNSNIKNQINQIKRLNSDKSFYISSFKRIKEIVDKILNKRIGRVSPPIDELLIRETCEGALNASQ